MFNDFEIHDENDGSDDAYGDRNDDDNEANSEDSDM